jgi:hypothetical protein
MYNPNDVQKPIFDFDMDLKQISISKAYTTFNTLQAMAPAAKGVDGRFSSLFRLKGNLTPQMTPDLPTVNGGGTIKISEGQIKDIKLVAGINSLLKTNYPTKADLKDIAIKTSIKDGRVFFEPFDIVAGGQKINLSGSNGLDGTIDYVIKSAVPAGAAGAAVGNALSSLLGKPISTPKEIKFEIGATGSAAAPKYKILKVDAGSSKEQVKSVVSEKFDQAKAEAEAKAKAEAARLKAEAEAKVKAETDRLKKDVEQKAKDELKKLKDKFRF